MSAADATRVRHEARSGISYERTGAGPAVVLLHGWCLSGRLWTYTAESLSADHDVVVPDQAGFGHSDAIAGPYVLERYADDLLLLLDELDLHDATIIGFAFGAGVAMAAAARDDARIGGLVLIGAPSAAHAAYDRMPRAMRRDWPEFARRSATAICTREHSAASLAWLEAMFAATPLPVALATVRLLGEFEPAPLAARVAVPALYVHGSEDPIVPVSVSEDCVAASATARLALVEGSGHLVVLDDGLELERLVREFVAAPTADADHIREGQDQR